MPPVIVAVAAAVAYGAATAGTIAALGGVAAATAFTVGGIAVSVGTIASVVGAIAGAIVAFAGNALVASISGKPKGKQDVSSAAADAKRTIRSEIAPRRIVYGRARVSGPLIYAGSFGANLEFLLLVIPLCDHEVEAIDAVWIGEHRVDNSEIAGNGDGRVIAGRFSGAVSIRRMLGDQQTADPQLVAECPDGWNPADRLTGIAHLVVRLRYDPDLFQSGVPSISAEVRGKKLYDPRTGVTAYSENWALVINDYLRGEHGIAANEDEVDLSTIITAANLSDEAVQITPAGATQPRYILNGTFTLDRQPIDVLEELLAPGGGALVYTAGQYRLYGGAYQAPAFSLTAADLASDVEVVTEPPRREIFNSVRGNYIEPNAFWQAHPFPPFEWLSFIAQDGEQIWRELELPFVLDATRAHRISAQLLQRSRQGVTVKVAVKYANLDLSVWQMVGMTLPDLGWDEKPFRVIGWSFSPESGLITLTMQEEQIASYAWSFDDVVNTPEFPDTTLVDPFATPAPIGLAVSEELYVTRDGAGVRTKALLTWAPPAFPFVTSYDVEFKPADDAAWRAAGGVVEPRGEVLDLQAGTWDFRVRARTAVAAGAWATLRRYIGGLAATPPAAVSGLSLATIGGLAFLRWDRTDELDVRVGGHYEIRHSPETVGATWTGATSIGEAVTGEASFALLPLKEGTYFIRAVDAGGVYGAEASITAAQATALAFANVTTVTDDPTFSGAKTGTVVISSTLRLDSSGLVDLEADFDAISNLDRLGGVLAEGSYAFSGGIDLTTVRNVRLTSRLLSVVDDQNDQWDDRVDAFDAWTTLDGVFGGEADAWVEARQTDDDPAGSPTWSAWRRLDSGEFRARAFQFRLIARSYDTAFNIHVSELSVAADEVV
jgi:hypothetical protein